MRFFKEQTPKEIMSPKQYAYGKADRLMRDKNLQRMSVGTICFLSDLEEIYRHYSAGLSDGIHYVTVLFKKGERHFKASISIFREHLDNEIRFEEVTEDDVKEMIFSDDIKTYVRLFGKVKVLQ